MIAASLALVAALATAGAPALAVAQAPAATYGAPVDPVVAKARAQARDSLPVFWSKFDAKPNGYDSFVVQVDMATPRGGSEAVWVMVVSRLGDTIFGRFANKPTQVAGLLGADVQASAANVVDWSYTRDGRTYGHFTTRAMFDRVSPEMRAKAQATLAPTALESESR
ncbi:MAG: DUF2314 domain-containing protein [Reyranella sp.]|nr:DUF2314 domain-containing protein [Reyranella sp.]